MTMRGKFHAKEGQLHSHMTRIPLYIIAHNLCYQDSRYKRVDLWCVPDSNSAVVLLDAHVSFF